MFLATTYFIFRGRGSGCLLEKEDYWKLRAPEYCSVYIRNMALRMELPVICVTSVLRLCLSSSHFACPTSSLKLINWRIFHAGFEPGSCFFRAWFIHFRALFVPFSSLVRASFEPGLCHFRAWFVPFSSLVCTIFEPGSCHFSPCFLPFSSPLRAIFKHSLC